MSGAVCAHLLSPSLSAAAQGFARAGEAAPCFCGNPPKVTNGAGSVQAASGISSDNQTSSLPLSLQNETCSELELSGWKTRYVT